MNITDFSDYFLYLVIFLPGFLSLKVYDLLVPSAPRDFSKSFFEVIAYSGLNYAIFLWPLNWGFTSFINGKINIIFYLILFVVMIVGPVSWPAIFLKLSRNSFFKQYIIDPTPKPWDHVFGKKEPSWIIVHLQNGGMIGGIYDTKSFTSSFPIEEQIYLEEVWEVDEQKNFIKPVDRSKGIIIFNEEIASVELFQ